MNNITRMALLAVQQRREDIFTDTVGICSNFKQALDIIGEGSDVAVDVGQHLLWLRNAFRAWPKFSGNDCYPVPHPLFVGVLGIDPDETDETDDVDAYMAHTEAVNAYDDAVLPWDTDTPYGQLRAELLAFLIERSKP